MAKAIFITKGSRVRRLHCSDIGVVQAGGDTVVIVDWPWIGMRREKLADLVLVQFNRQAIKDPDGIPFYEKN
jgi:hypothetical protein